MSGFPKISFSTLEDAVVDALSPLVTWLKGNSPMAGFVLISGDYTTAGTYRLRHNLGFVPKDIVSSKLVLSGTMALSWTYADFTTQDVILVLTGTGTCSFRGFVGTHDPNLGSP